MLKLLDDLKKNSVISELNYQFAKLIDNKQQAYHYTPLQQNLAILLSALVSFNVMQGHSCIRLDSALAQNPFGLRGKPFPRDFYAEIMQKIEGIEPLAWQSVLAEHIAFSHTPSQIAPLLFQHQRLYFYRYWQAENDIARYLQQAVNSDEKNAETALDKQILARFFTEQQEIDWQKIAVATALTQKFSLISGGPGTGKTRTVAILLAALQLKRLEQQQLPLKMALVAPTGKAAARLKESIATNLHQLSLPEAIKNSVPTNAATLHSLLGIIPQRDSARYHARNPLPLDLLVVDEASMIDLFTLEKLFNALKPSTRLILLGDKDQLASVEAGNLMGELGQFIPFGYSAAHSHYLQAVTGYAITPLQSQPPAICDSLCHLRHSYRFNQHSGIGRLASAINHKQAVDSWKILADNAFPDLQLYTYPAANSFSENRLWIQHCIAQVVATAVNLYRHYLTLVEQRMATPEQVSVREIFHAFQQVRFLCALRVSELGADRLNHHIAEALRQAQLVRFNQTREIYLGKPLLITENAPQNQIFSGDIGLVLNDEQGKLRIYFETQIDGQHLSLSPSRLPSYEAAYVMTVHKSQGSEFEHTLLVMPQTYAPLLTKELLYTAVTRAKNRFSLFCDEKVWKQAVKTEVQRQSGLSQQLLSSL